MSLESKSVNWCSLHRIQFPCDKQCPDCQKSFEEKFRKELATISWAQQGRCAGSDTGSYQAHIWPHLTEEIISALRRAL